MNPSSFEKVSAIRGMNDLLPDNARLWLRLEALLLSWLKTYGYEPIRTPVLEHTRLFTRGIGEVTDIVEKEMYTFIDALNQESLTLRPEFTAGMVRAVIEHNLTYDSPRRLFNAGPVFRHERPQRGRYRQFHQLDVEAMGFEGPDIDAEQIVMLSRLWALLGLKSLRLEINSLGSPDERRAHRAALITYLESHQSALDSESQRRLHLNPLRVLDSKHPDVQAIVNDAPRLLDYLGAASKAHFERLCIFLDKADIAYVINPRLVRGLDYYNLTVFEWISDELGAQGTVCGGGRYDGLASLLGGKATPAIGFAIGLERLISLWQIHIPPPEPYCDAYLLHSGNAASQRAFETAERLRDAGLQVIWHCGLGGLKSQMKRADACGAQYALIFAEDEMATESVAVKPLRAAEQALLADGKTQWQVPLSTLTEWFASMRSTTNTTEFQTQRS